MTAPDFDDSDLDGWMPTDDPDEWNEDGTRRGSETENLLRWRIVQPNGEVIEQDASGLPIMSRMDAVAMVSAPHLASIEACRCLHCLTHEVAGWASIEAHGWKIEPMPEGS